MTPASPLLRLPGAVAADGVDAGVAWHYGDPVAEQRRLEAGAARVDLSHRPVLRVSGPDRHTWLDTLTTQRLLDLAPGERTDTLLLSPQGHVLHHLQLVDDGSAVLAHVEPGTAEPLMQHLLRMRFWSEVEVEDVTDAYAVVGDRDGWQLVARADLVAAVGDGPAGTWAAEALRVAARRPRLGLDTDHRTIPNEVGWLGGAVHLGKGCYPGQETVAKVHNLGRPPRRLGLLHLDGGAETLPAHGEPVELDGRPVGRVGTAVRHHELGAVALALVKRSVPAGARLLAGGQPAAEDVVVVATTS